VLNHFTEKFDPAFCEGTCDNCASTEEVTNVDLTTHATQYVNMFNELEKKHMKITGPQSINAFRATQKPEMARRSFNTLDNYAKGSDLSVDLVKRLLDHLIVRQILTTDLEEPPDPNRAPISYVYVLIFFTLVTLALTRFFAARAQGKGVSEQASLRLEDSLRKERHRRREIQEGFTATGSCIDCLDQEEAHTIGRCG
jgi:superfamily II DNA helicase RecQ